MSPTVVQAAGEVISGTRTGTTTAGPSVPNIAGRRGRRIQNAHPGSILRTHTVARLAACPA